MKIVISDPENVVILKICSPQRRNPNMIKIYNLFSTGIF